VYIVESFGGPEGEYTFYVFPTFVAVLVGLRLVRYAAFENVFDYRYSGCLRYAVGNVVALVVTTSAFLFS
jgi:hypothetical protein